jgi:hypothetical protein
LDAGQENDKCFYRQAVQYGERLRDQLIKEREEGERLRTIEREMKKQQRKQKKKFET